MPSNCIKILMSFSLVCMAFVCIAFAGSKIEGQIIAYRPFENFFQTASMAPNREEYLFKVSGAKVNVIKLVYEHYGYSRLTGKMLAEEPTIDATVYRDKKCDETYGDYIKHSSPINLGNKLSKPIIFIEDMDEVKLLSGQHLKCYRVKDDDIHVFRKSDSARLTVLSIRKVTDDDDLRYPPIFRNTHVVRFRFDAPRDNSVFLYAPHCEEPGGYYVIMQSGEKWWSVDFQKSSKSPGFKKLENKKTGCWLRMTAGSSLEWEIPTISLAGVMTQSSMPVEQAQSVFVKKSEKDDPVELFSPWYTLSK
jgi:hypothetical protein